ncbi:hypothetical protein [Halocatena marina]|uniref:hypothetical protein n=1 Tax=Halocatena marina TaxID=2934937 RepID=UPI00200D86D2|nr:hypothetical protein [Halocatena marina]
MIAGTPRILDRDGTRVLVDANGDKLVCRRLSPYAHGCYHRVDLERYACDKTVKPRCGHVTGHDDTHWVLRRHAVLAQTWDGCLYSGCYGNNEATATGETGPQLAAALADMSVTEFEAAVTDQSVDRSGGEQA